MLGWIESIRIEMRRGEGRTGNVVLVGGEHRHVTTVMWWWLASVVVRLVVVDVVVDVVAWVDQHAKRMAAGLRPGQP
jgi:hypothetical protein